MKFNRLCFALIATVGFTTAQAQVKIGANPTTIGSTNNLEVEATGGNKTSVNKVTGQVTIQDGTQGANKILTSDASGNASWRQLGGQSGAGFDSYLIPSAPFTINENQGEVYPFPDVTITEQGTYMAIVRTFGNVDISGKTLAFYSSIRKNGTTAGQDTYEWYTASGDNGVFGVSGTLIFSADVGDVVTVLFRNAYSYNPTINIPANFLARNNIRFVKIR